MGNEKTYIIPKEEENSILYDMIILFYVDQALCDNVKVKPMSVFALHNL